jgi:hypothetical protein
VGEEPATTEAAAPTGSAGIMITIMQIVGEPEAFRGDKGKGARGKRVRGYPR